MNEEQEENVSGYTRDIKDFLRKNDFDSALILINDLKKYVTKLKKLSDMCIAYDPMGKQITM